MGYLIAQKFTVIQLPEHMDRYQVGFTKKAGAYITFQICPSGHNSKALEVMEKLPLA